MITRLNKEVRENDSPLIQELEVWATESAKLIANAVYEESVSRKAFVAPVFKKSLQQVLKQSPTDTKLFGDKILERAEEHERVKKIMAQPRGTMRFPRGGMAPQHFLGRPTYPTYPMPYPPTMSGPGQARQRFTTGRGLGRGLPLQLQQRGRGRDPRRSKPKQ